MNYDEGYETEHDIPAPRVSIKESCAGICISEASEKDQRFLKVTMLVEDDEMWFIGGDEMSTSWMRETQRCVETAKFWLHNYGNLAAHEHTKIEDYYANCKKKSEVEHSVTSFKEGCIGILLSLRGDGDPHILYSVIYFDTITNEWYIAERGFPAMWLSTLSVCLSRATSWLYDNCKPDGWFGFNLAETSPYWPTMMVGE